MRLLPVPSEGPRFGSEAFRAIRFGLRPRQYSEVPDVIGYRHGHTVWPELKSEFVVIFFGDSLTE